MPYTAGNAARYSCKPSLFANSVKKEQSEKLLFSLVRTDGKTRTAGRTEKPTPLRDLSTGGAPADSRF